MLADAGEIGDPGRPLAGIQPPCLGQRLGRVGRAAGDCGGRCQVEQPGRGLLIRGGGDQRRSGRRGEGSGVRTACQVMQERSEPSRSLERIENGFVLPPLGQFQ